MFDKPPLIDRGVSTLPPASLPDRKRCDLSVNLHPLPNPHPFLAGGLAGAASNDHAAAKLSRQTLMRCAALLASHPCHPSPPPEPFLSPGAGDSSAHGRHLGLKMRLRLPVAAQAGLTRPEARRTPDFLHILQEMDSAASLAACVMFSVCLCVCLCGTLRWFAVCPHDACESEICVHSDIP